MEDEREEEVEGEEQEAERRKTGEGRKREGSRAVSVKPHCFVVPLPVHTQRCRKCQFTFHIMFHIELSLFSTVSTVLLNRLQENKRARE